MGSIWEDKYYIESLEKYIKENKFTGERRRNLLRELEKMRDMLLKQQEETERENGAA